MNAPPRLRMALHECSPETPFSENDRAGIERYLPSAYSVVLTDRGDLLIYGYDVAGWTMQDYVLPRLASGLHYFVEVGHDG